MPDVEGLDAHAGCPQTRPPRLFQWDPREGGVRPRVLPDGYPAPTRPRQPLSSNGSAPDASRIGSHKATHHIQPRFRRAPLRNHPSRNRSACRPNLSALVPADRGGDHRLASWIGSPPLRYRARPQSRLSNPSVPSGASLVPDEGSDVPVRETGPAKAAPQAGPSKLGARIARRETARARPTAGAACSARTPTRHPVAGVLQPRLLRAS